MAITVSITILGLLVALIGIEMVNTPPTKSWHKWAWRLGFIAIGAIIITLTCVQTYNQSKEDQRKSAEFADQIDGLKTSFSKSLNQSLDKQSSEMLHDFSTNENLAPIVRLAILQDQQAKVLQEKTNLINQSELIPITTIDVKTLRADRENKAAIQAQQNKANELQSAMDAIKQQQVDAKEVSAKTLKQQNEKEKADKKQKLQIQQYEKVFDYTIRTFNTMLSSLSQDAGQNLSSDFPNGLPTIYGSRLEDDGKFIFGKQLIAIGTNDGWNFKVSIIESRNDGMKVFHFPVPNDNWDQNLFFGLQIVGCDTNVTLLRVVPVCSDASTIPLADHVWVMLCLKKNVIIDEYPSIDSYHTNVDSALKTLLELQDKQFPLPVKTNAQ